MRRFLLLFSLCLTVIFLNLNSNVRACSGVGVVFAPVLLNFHSAPLVVSGRISSLSDSGINAILDVEAVLKGELTNNRIILKRNSIEDLQMHEAGRGVATPCTQIAPRLEQGRQFVANLYPNISGSYIGSIATENDNGYFVLYDFSREKVRRSYDEMIEYLSQEIHQMPTVPPSGLNPRPVVIHLFTDTKEYQVPLNSMEAFEPYVSSICFAPTEFDSNSCIKTVVAPNGIDKLSLLSVPIQSDVFRAYQVVQWTAIQGDDAVFSTQSDLLAVWRGQELRIYATPRQIGLSPESQYSTTLLTKWIMEADDPLITGAGAWSPNGRTFAFSTESSIWLWDTLQPNSQPTLLKRGAMRVRHFSPNGNFLAVESDISSFYIDMYSLQAIPDGKFSPDDRLLALYDTTQNGLTPMQLYAVAPRFQSIWNNYSEMILQLEWIDNNTLIYSACGDEPIYIESETLSEPNWCKVRKLELGVGDEWFDGIQFDYDPITESLITLQKDNRVNLNGEILDFSDQISEPIIHVEISPEIDLAYWRF